MLNLSPMNLILASSSPYRRQLLEQLGLNFQCESPEINETPLDNEDINSYVARLALAKAHAIKATRPGSLVIASDQACALGGMIIGKPGNFEQARKQLIMCSGQSLTFYTALVVLNTTTGEHQSDIVTYTVTFRNLQEDEITAYLHAEQPYDCAGSFKVEGLGISLFSAMAGSDYNSLIGLPLISLCNMLRFFGLNPLLPTASLHR